MKQFLIRALACVLAFLIFSAPAFAQDAPSRLEANPILKYALSLLEEGNPFLTRYNQITGDSAQAVMPEGVPYLWGGRNANMLFCMAPEYVLQQAWTSSPGGYYKEGTLYFYGFDCFGYVAWVWQQACGRAMPSMNSMFADTRSHILDRQEDIPESFDMLSPLLRPGDILVLEHPGRHIAIYIGTLRMYGYTESDLPELKDHLDDPLMIHSSENAQVADRFSVLIKEGLHKYCVAQPPDGGVHVTLLTRTPGIFTNAVTQQKATTRYLVLPDGTWLTPMDWSRITRFCFVRPPVNQ